jgi:hypothetical protein
MAAAVQLENHKDVTGGDVLGIFAVVAVVAVGAAAFDLSQTL